MYKLFGIPNCDTVKKARAFLESNSIPFEFIDFKKVPPTQELISLWQKAFGELPVNKKGQTYKKYAKEFEKLTKQAQVTFLIKNSSMIKRPILQKDKNILSFGFDGSEYKKQLGV